MVRLWNCQVGSWAEYMKDGSVHAAMAIEIEECGERWHHESYLGQSTSLSRIIAEYKAIEWALLWLRDRVGAADEIAIQCSMNMARQQLLGRWKVNRGAYFQALTDCLKAYGRLGPDRIKLSVGELGAVAAAQKVLLAQGLKITEPTENYRKGN